MQRTILYKAALQRFEKSIYAIETGIATNTLSVGTLTTWRF